MENQESSSDIFEKIPFPFEHPYPQQADLMKSIIKTIQNGNIGLFESPTGTGKSLSVICSMLHWLRFEENKIKAESQSSNNDNGSVSSAGVDWLDDFIATNSKEQEERKAKYHAFKLRDRFLQRINNKRNLRYRPVLTRKSFSGTASLLKVPENGVKSHEDKCDMFSEHENDADAEFLLSNYESGDETSSCGGRDADDATPDLHSIKIEDIPLDDSTKLRFDTFPIISEIEEKTQVPKLYYCSRTHSQLAQFIGEVKRVSESCLLEAPRCITLGSRSNLCINPSVRSLSSDTAMSEKCLDMQQKQSKTASTNNKEQAEGKRRRISKSISKKCEFRSVKSEQHFVEHALGEVSDVEDLIHLGKTVEACPYYGTRRGIAQAQIICLPYNLIVSKESRDALGISLKNNVVIFDEAHNIVESVNAVHSVEISYVQLNVAKLSLQVYLKRFRNILNGKNFFYVNLLIKILGSFQRQAKTRLSTSGCVEAAGGSTAVYSVNDFVFSCSIDNVNLRKVVRYTELSQLVRKVGGHVESEIKKIQESNVEPSTEMQAISSSGVSASFSLRQFFSLLKALRNSEEDGRVFVIPDNSATKADSRPSEHNTIRYVLMNPANHFLEVIDSARSVLFLGGTLQPFGFISSSLFPQSVYSDMHTSETRPVKSIDTFSCSHIIPSSHIATFAVDRGPSNMLLDFRHGNRENEKLIIELFWSVYKICVNVPNGVVLFFTSYSYMSFVVTAWKRLQLITRLNALKHVCIEQRKSLRHSNQNDDCKAQASTDAWSDFCSFVQSAGSKGAVLFSVMGGKLSEGINFSDELARAVIIVGMPYPDLSDPVLKEKLSHAEKQRKGSSKLAYEGMCMKAINQSIGRAIRHINDYAVVVLLDHRYVQRGIMRQLPAWIQNSPGDNKKILHSEIPYRSVVSAIRAFFNEKNESNKKDA